jgi:hypothetical protein
VPLNLFETRYNDKTLQKDETIYTFGNHYLWIELCGNGTSKRKITGSVSDNQHKIVEFPTATLLKAKDSTLVKGALGDANGHFEFESVNAGEYLVSVTQMGYKVFYAKNHYFGRK